MRPLNHKNDQSHDIEGQFGEESSSSSSSSPSGIDRASSVFVSHERDSQRIHGHDCNGSFSLQDSLTEHLEPHEHISRAMNGFVHYFTPRGISIDINSNIDALLLDSQAVQKRRAAQLDKWLTRAADLEQPRTRWAAGLPEDWKPILGYVNKFSVVRRNVGGRRP